MIDSIEQLKIDLKLAAKDLGIDAIGIASPNPFTTLKTKIERSRALNYASGFEPKDIEKSVNPSLVFEQPQSIIAIGVAYHAKMDNPPKSVPGSRRGIMARTAWGEDYHHVLSNRLDRLEQWLSERVPDVKIKSMVDTGELVDRAVAERAGIGWSGKNCAVISPELGSFIFLGEMITNIPFEPDTPITDQCGSCNKCIDACPTGALVGPGQLNAQSCVSYLTQTKHTLPDHFMKKIGNRLYGCDTCQIVCPENKGKNWTQNEEFKPDPEIAKPLLLPILELTNKQFKEQFGHTSAAWRGRKPIQRNAVIALGNFKDPYAIPALIKVLMNDERETLRATAAWSLGQIKTQQSLEALERALETEKNEEVIQYIKRAKLLIMENN